jgi:hypothetical protein
MYQVEVKRWLVSLKFPPRDGWIVTVDIDAMERARGGTHAADKAERARVAEDQLRTLGAKIGKHPIYGRADVVAEHTQHGTWLVEVEGQSSRQPEQAMYSAIGQLVIQLQGGPMHIAIAVPDDLRWRKQVAKVSSYARQLLGLTCFLVSPSGCRTDVQPEPRAETATVVQPT